MPLDRLASVSGAGETSPPYAGPAARGTLAEAPRQDAALVVGAECLFSAAGPHGVKQRQIGHESELIKPELDLP